MDDEQGQHASTSNRTRSSAQGPGRIVSHYRLDRQLGVGGMGEVYLANDLVLGRPAAVKLLPDNWDEELRTRLIREAKASARLEHPGIATFHEAGDVDGVAFLAMEYVEGETLRSRLRREALPLREALSVTACILEALSHAHAMGILHRDIKPENIMLPRAGIAKLLDFGLAKTVDRETADHSPMEPIVGSSTSGLHPLPESLPDVASTEDQMRSVWTQLTGHEGIAGTPGYMSPEQVLGLPLNPSSDLFAVGTVLYEMITGRSAFGGATAEERMAATLHIDLPALVGAEVPAGLEDVLHRAMARVESDRYPTAGSFLADLRRVDESDVIDTLPATLAVLGFENASGHADDDWIGTGLVDGLTNGLAHVPGLEVVAQDRVARTRAALAERMVSPSAIDLGARLACRWVLTGSFQRAEDVLRVTARLDEVGTGNEVGAEDLQGRLDEIADIQNRLLAFVGNQLRLGSRTHALSEQKLEAFECYARGRRAWQHFQRGSLEQASELFEKAIQVDPHHAPSLSALAMLSFSRYINTTDPRHLEQTIGYARRAIEIDPLNAETHVWFGYALWRQNHQDEALAQFLSAEALDSNNHFPPYFAGCCLLDLGRHPEAVGHLQQSVQCDPGFSWARFNLGWAHLELGHFDEARWCFEQAVELEHDPARSTNVARPYLCETLRRVGDLDAARRVCLDALDFVERSDTLYRDQARGLTLCVLGRTALEQADLPAARVAYSQVLAHVRGRPRGIGLGHLVVQCLAGRTRAEEGPEPFVEALELFEARDSSAFDFGWAGPLSNGVTLLELARAAQVLGRGNQAQSLLRRAREAGSGEARLVEIS